LGKYWIFVVLFAPLILIFVTFLIIFFHMVYDEIKRLYIKKEDKR
tara:strand:+ start:588 stop:722 length:135 start_codon:yes stop_codon:yes gene_type:complete